MRLSRRLMLGLCGLICLFGLPSCTKKSDGSGDKIKVAVVTNNSDPFWAICEQGAKAAAAKHEVELIFRMPERGEAGLQRDIVNEAERLGATGVAVSVIDPKEQTPALKLVSKKINLLTMDSDAPDSGRLTYVGTDNYAAGRAVGELVLELHPNGGTIAIFVGQSTPQNARERFQGVVDVLAGEKDAKGTKDGDDKMFGKFRLYKGEAITDNKSEQTALENAKDALEKLKGTPNLIMVGLWAYNPPAILTAAKAKSMVGKVSIVAFDENPATLSGIENGEIHATVVQDPYNFGYKSVEILAQLAKGGSKDQVPSGMVPHRVVMKAAGKHPTTGEDRLSVKQFKEDFDKKMGK